MTSRKDPCPFPSSLVDFFCFQTGPIPENKNQMPGCVLAPGYQFRDRQTIQKNPQKCLGPFSSHSVPSAYQNKHNNLLVQAQTYNMSQEKAGEIDSIHIFLSL